MSATRRYPSDDAPVPLSTGKMLPLQEAMRWNDVSRIVRRFGTWAVTEHGVECLSTHYPIRASRLREDEDVYPWERHLGRRVWLDSPADLCRALEFGRSYHESGRGKRPVITDEELEERVRTTLTTHPEWFAENDDESPLGGVPDDHQN